ncbi:MAG: PilZ domain-containing protein [Deltaproteobacteria bacterium]|nr:PilZ domain-containing protein [Deltaproteobacteria bacterium]
MRVEQRCDEKRIEISRPIEVLDPSVGLGVPGYTKDLSASGIRARVEVAPSPGDLVQLEIELADGTSPLATQGEVIWCAPDIYGDGAEVGLKFVAESKDEEPEQATQETKGATPKPGIVQPGQHVTINATGHAMVAIVDEVVTDEEDPNGAVQISLRVVASTEAVEEETLEGAEDWKPHPFRDAKEWFVRYIGPVFAVLARVAGPLGRLAFRGLGRLWAALPSKVRRPFQNVGRRLDLSQRISKGRDLARSLFTFLGGKIGDA